METASLWTSSEPDLLLDYGDLRLNCPTEDWKPDYVVGARSRADGCADLFLGSKTDGVMHMKLSPSQEWTVQRLLKGQHAEEEIVRCAISAEDVTLTGGEDGRLVIWPATQEAPVLPPVEKKSKSQRYAPY